MKIQCDVCSEEAAAVYCSADEAALCSACDRRVHHANILAGKHHRFSLLQPTPSQFPLCDICQEKRAFLFCQQDRAILCKDCDIPIHKASVHTQNHNRFLLTGVKLSATSSLYSPSSSATSSSKSMCDAVPNLDPVVVSVSKPVSAKIAAISNPPTTEINCEKVFQQNSNNQLTSVSQYLMEMPGWHVEDLLDSSPASFGLSQSGDDFTIWDADLERNLSPISSSESFGIWVPQAPTPLYSTQYQSSNISSFGGQVGYKEKETNGNKSSKKWREDSSFTVPQINPPPSISKRPRTYW